MSGIMQEPEKATELDPPKDLSDGSADANQSLGQRGFSVNQGWIKIHRKILDWEWYGDDNVFRVFFHLLLTVNHEPKRWRGIDIKVGQIITGRQSLAQQLGLSEQQIRTALNKLKSTNEITIVSTKQYSIITIQKWKNYQEVTSKSTNEQPTSNQRATTTKEVKNERSKEEHLTSIATSVAEPVNEFIGLFKEVNPSYESLYANRTQRAAAARLLKKFGYEAMRKTLLIVQKTNEQPYAPVITSPLELEKNGGRLKAFIQKNQREQLKNQIISI